MNAIAQPIVDSSDATEDIHLNPIGRDTFSEGTPWGLRRRGVDESAAWPISTEPDWLIEGDGRTTDVGEGWWPDGETPDPEETLPRFTLPEGSFAEAESSASLASRRVLEALEQAGRLLFVGRPTEALDVLEHARRIDPHHPLVLDLLRDVRLRLSGVQPRAPRYTESAHVPPASTAAMDAASHFAVALAYEAMGLVEEALRELHLTHGDPSLERDSSAMIERINLATRPEPHRENVEPTLGDDFDRAFDALLG